VNVRYVAGLYIGIEGRGPEFSVVRLVEDDDGERLSNPVTVIDGMTEAQARELYEQLGNVLVVTS
jgi:hypothetical protein